ncbi:MAG: Lrp/AsnC family transcriptional regulator, partial [Gammaproteobacteria bacterium]
GLVVNHHALGYRHNAMVVFNVPDEQVDEVARRICQTGKVNLCYRRPRRPNWPYNLFCMFHGRSREAVMDQLGDVMRQTDIHHLPHEVLFSTRQFKQCGGHYGLTVPPQTPGERSYE